MQTTLVRPQDLRLYFSNLPKHRQLQTALSITRALIDKLSPEQIGNIEKEEIKQNLSTAILIMRQTRHKKDLTTRVLFLYTRKNIDMVDLFLRTEAFGTLGKIVDVPFCEIESALSKVGLDVPLALKIFHKVYDELVAERSKQIA